MFSISLADGLLLLEVQANHGLIGLFYGLLLLDALEVLLLVLRDLLCVEIDAVSTVVCVARRSWPSFGAELARRGGSGRHDGVPSRSPGPDAVDAIHTVCGTRAPRLRGPPSVFASFDTTYHNLADTCPSCSSRRSIAFRVPCRGPWPPWLQIARLPVHQS